MDPIQYQSFLRERGYNPKNISSPVGLADVNRQLTEQMQQNIRDQESKDVREVQQLKDRNKEIRDFMSGLSKSLKEQLESRAIEEAKEAKAEAAAQARQDYLAGASKSPEFALQLGAAREADAEANAAAAEIQGGDPKNQNAVFPLYSQTSWKQAMYTLAYAKQRIASELPTMIRERIDALNPPTPAERRAIAVEVEKQFLTQSGIAELNPQMQQQLYESIASASDPILDQYDRKDAQNNSEEQRAKDSIILTETGDLNAFLGSVSVGTGPNGDVLGNAGAWNILETELATLVRSGAISAERYAEMKNSIVASGPSKGKTFLDAYRTRFARIDNAIATGIQQDNALKAGQRRLRNQTIEDDLVRIALERGDQLTTGDLDELQERYMIETSGEVSQKLQNLRSRTADVQQKEEQKQELLELQARNALSPLILDSYDPQVAAPFRSDAEQQARTRAQNNNYTEQEDILQAYVFSSQAAEKGPRYSAWTANGVPIIKDFTILAYVTDKKIAFRQRVARYLAAGDPDAVQKALQETQLEVKNDIAVDWDPSAKIFKKYKDVPNPSNKTAAALATVELHIRTVGKANYFNDPEKTGFTREELNTLQTDASGNELPRLQMNEKVRYVANMMGLDPVAFLVKLRETHGLPGVPDAPFLRRINEAASPELLQQLQQYKSPAQSARVLYQADPTGQMGIESLPQNVGDAIQTYSTQYTVPPALLAAVVSYQASEYKNTVNPEVVRAIADSVKMYLDKAGGDIDTAISLMAADSDNPAFTTSIKQGLAGYGGGLPVRPSVQSIQIEQ